MYNINEVTIDQISHLDALQLSQVLHRLLLSEAEKYQLEDYTPSVAFNITSGDGGSDGKLEWAGNPVTTNRLKHKYTLFQNKATELFPGECYEEILLPKVDGQQRELKSEVNKVVDIDGSYILFTNRALTDSSKESRIIKFREAVKDAGKASSATFNIEVFDANTIKDWANEYLSVVTLIQHLNGIDRPQGFRDWNTLNIDLKAPDTTYKFNSTNTAYIKQIQDSIAVEKVIRVIGHSGLGKSRLILEAFRNVDATSTALQQQFVYYDLGATQNLGEITRFIINHRLNQSGIIIIDNCDVESHLKLSEIIKPQGSLKIITIGLEDSRSIEDLKIKLDRENQRDLVREIIVDKIGETHSLADIEYVNNLSEGYPWMAVRFCKAIKETGIAGFDEILPDEFIEKLLFGTRPNDILEYGIIRACSVFSAFGFLDDSFASVINQQYKDSLLKQMEFIRTEVCDDHVSESKFKETCTKFLKDDIIEKRGTFYIVKPTVLAIHLAAKWLIATPATKIKIIVEKLKDKNLDQKFLERLIDLDQLDKAKDIVDELWGRASFFGSAEVLKSSWGSLLFRYVVEVNPVATTRSLVDAFGNSSKSELLELTEGRRNLVWALEKLAFHKETFYAAAKVLFAFGVSENENWANNASHQAAQLFQRFLAGTEADYNDRIAVLEWALERKDEDFTKLAIGCIARAFIPSGNHGRDGGAEKQGSGRPLIDYEPQTWEEIRHYWQTLMDMLVNVIKTNAPNAQSAKNVVTGAIRTLVMDNSAEIVISAVKEIHELSGDIWLEALSEFKKALAYERDITAETLKKVNDLISELTPQNLHDQFMLKVILAEFDYGDYSGNNQRKKVEEFAEYLIKDNIDWSVEIPNLLTGEQRQTLNFGRKVAEISTEPDKLLAEAIFELKIVPKEQQNAQLIVGLLLGLNDSSQFEKTLDEFINEPLIVHHVFNLVRIYSPGIESFNKLFQPVDDKVFDIRFFNNLIFGSPLSHLSKEDIQEFCNRIASYGKPGKWVAFSILFMYCYQNETKWDEQKDLIRSLLISENLIIGDRQNSLDPFYWTTAASKLLKTGNDPELAKIISIQLTEFCLDENFSYAFDHYLFEVFHSLFDHYFSIAWPFISDAIVDIYPTYMHLKSMIGSKNGNNGKQGVLFAFEKNYQEIYQWCETDPKGVLRIAYMMPIEKLRNPDSGDETPDWHQFSKVFIDKFGKNEKMLSEISANMGTYGSVGSSVPYYVTQKTLLEKLLTHSIITVREWAKRMLEYTNKSIKVESLGDEQRFID